MSDSLADRRAASLVRGVSDPALVAKKLADRLVHRSAKNEGDHND